MTTYAGRWRDCCNSGEYEPHEKSCEYDPENMRFARIEKAILKLSSYVIIENETDGFETAERAITDILEDS